MALGRDDIGIVDNGYVQLQNAGNALLLVVEKEIKRYKNMTTGWRKYVRITKGIEDREIEGEKAGEKAGAKKKLGGKLTLLQDANDSLRKFLEELKASSSAEFDANVEKFIKIHIPQVARILHHKRTSTFDQIRNKSLFWGVFAVIGFYCFPPVFALFGLFSAGGPWMTGLISASIGAGIGQLLNFTSWGKYFGGQAKSQAAWEALAEHAAFSQPKDKDKSPVQASIYRAMQSTLPYFFSGSSGNRSTSVADISSRLIEANKSDGSAIGAGIGGASESITPTGGVTGAAPVSGQVPLQVIKNYEDQRKYYAQQRCSR